MLAPKDEYAGNAILRNTMLPEAPGFELSLRARESGPAIERLQAKKSLQEVVVTDTIGLPPEKLIPKVKVLSVAPLFGEAIKRIHSGESVGVLFR